METDFQIIDMQLNEFLQSITEKDEVEIYTDGSCRGNPGPGGWGVIIIYKNKRVTLSGAEKNTTNNRMELTAAIEALKAIPENIRIQIFTDSNYVREGISVWLTNWKKNNWQTVNKTPVKNKDLWIILDKLANNRNVKWNWVKGHADCMNNNNADFVARSACDNLCNE